MSEKKEIKKEQLGKVAGGGGTIYNEGTVGFKPEDITVPLDGGAVYNNKFEIKPETDQYQPDLGTPVNQGGIDNPETTNVPFGLGK